MTPRARRVASSVALLALALFVTVLLWAGTALVRVVPLASPDAVISLASHEWERLPAAAQVARAHPASVVILTQPPSVTEHNCHDCANRVAWLARLGIPPERVHVVPIEPGPGTYGEAVACRRFAAAHGIRRLLVVTSPFHTRRALATFRDVFEGTDVEIGIRPAAETSAADPPSWWRTPYGRWYVAYEWAGIAYYAWKFGFVAATGSAEWPLGSALRQTLV